MSELLPKFPSRAGYKLFHFLQRFKNNEIANLELIKSIIPLTLEIENQTCMDLGASNGGFTACLLNAGAKKVYSVDVSYGIFDWTLRNDPRVVVLERTNARAISPQLILDPINIVTSDLSFISSAKVAQAVSTVITSDCLWLMLCKPQFEIKRDYLATLNKTQIKKGVILDPIVIKRVLIECLIDLNKKGFAGIPVEVSQVPGKDGNHEYWFILWLNDKLDFDLINQLMNDLFHHEHEV